MKPWLLGTLFFFLFSQMVFANKNVLNIYAWAEEIPDRTIKQFEKETGIKVHYSTFDRPEAMLAKIRTNQHIGYDIVEPGSGLLLRMKRLGILEEFDPTLLPNLKHIDPFFLNLSFDRGGHYTIPLFWGTTGIFINKDYYSAQSIHRWSDLFHKKYLNQLLLLDDAREVFAMALQVLGHPINHATPNDIREAYYKIKKLLPNVRLFNSDAINSILIDEDATIGMAWSGDLYKAQLENPKLTYVLPEDGPLFWVDTFSILKNAPHRKNAYQFLNFLMRPDIAMQASMIVGYATCNQAAYALLPKSIRNNRVLYPEKNKLNQNRLLFDMSDETSAWIEKYWALLKMGG